MKKDLTIFDLFDAQDKMLEAYEQYTQCEDEVEKKSLLDVYYKAMKLYEDISDILVERGKEFVL